MSSVLIKRRKLLNFVSQLLQKELKTPRMCEVRGDNVVVENFVRDPWVKKLSGDIKTFFDHLPFALAIEFVECVVLVAKEPAL